MEQLMFSKKALGTIVGIITFSLIAAFTSQTLVDIADTLVVLTAFYYAYTNHEIRVFFRGFKPAVLWPIWLLIVTLGLVVNLGSFNSQTNIQASIQVILSFIEFKWIITLLSFIYLVEKYTEPKKFLEIIIYTVLTLNLLSLFFYFYRPDEIRAAGVFNAVMAFSHNIAPIFCLFTVLIFVNWVYFNRNEKILITIIALTSYLLVLLTYTRGVWIGSAVAITVCLSLSNLWSFKRAIQFLSIFIFVGTILVFTNKSVHDRALSITKVQSSSYSIRLALWKAHWRMVQDYPFLGVGFGENKKHLRKYYDEFSYPADMMISHAHNQYLEVWAGTGTLGFICYLVFLLAIFKTAWRGYENAELQNKALLLGLISALLCFVIAALIEANFNIYKNRFLFLLLAGLAIGFSNQNFLKKPSNHLPL